MRKRIERLRNQVARVLCNVILHTVATRGYLKLVSGAMAVGTSKVAIEAYVADLRRTIVLCDELEQRVAELAAREHAA